MSSLGAYFGSTKIVQGSGGLGQGPLQAFADGVVGGNATSADMPGPLFAYQDGSLGAAPLQAYADGVVGGSAEDADMPGSLLAYEDGSLGPHFSGMQYSDSGGGVGPGSGGGSGGEAMADMPAPVLSYQDGVFGGRGGTCGLGGPVGPLQAFHDGSLGAISADAPAAVGGATLDLGDAATLGEVKGLILLMSGTALLTAQQILEKLPADWVTNGIWDTPSSQLWQLFVSINPNFKGLAVSTQVGSQVVPNAQALAWLVATVTAPVQGSPGVDWAKKSIPNLYGWVAAGGGPVLAPYLSLEDKVKGVRGDATTTKANMMAWYGLGAAALLGVALVLSKKR